ncbi:MAG TPA: hypothetical protein VGR08_11325 [Thermomicrobiales bacterium]|nr:hypothetical protein [Thermomicrobiales bacterium]
MSARHVSTPGDTRDSIRGGPMTTAWQWITVVLAMAILLQAVLASFGLFEGEARLVDVHRELGNMLPLLALAQAVMAAILFRRKVLRASSLWIAIVLFPLVTGQLMMGYETSENATAIALHIPLGVLLMSLTTMNAVLAWILHPGRR